MQKIAEKEKNIAAEEKKKNLIKNFYDFKRLVERH